MDKNLNQIENFDLNIDNYEGPLDLLLDLAKTQKVDLMQISIEQLADSYIKVIEKVKKNLELAADFLVMAAWLAYLKSRLLLPDEYDDDFSALEMAEKLKLQLRKLEMIRLLSTQLMKKKQIGIDIFFRGGAQDIKGKNKSKYKLSLYELIKSYADFKRKQNFSKIDIVKLPVYTMESAIKKISAMFNSIKEWCDIKKTIPKLYLNNKKLHKTGLCGTLVASLELVREGELLIRQKNIYDKIFIKKK